MRSHLRRTGKTDRPTGYHPPRSEHHVFDRVKAAQYRPQWKWDTFEGSEAALKWSFRDLRNLDETLKIVPARNAAIQAGGNLGFFPKRLAEEFEAVYCFEPDPHLFRITSATACEANVIKFQAALGNERQLIRTSHRRRDPSGRAEHEGLTHVAGTGIIPTLRIDDLALAHCDLIYLDIEGFELHALAGAEKTIQRCRPVIAIELNGNCLHYGHTEEQIRRWVINQHYERKLAMNSDEVFIPTL